MGRLKLIAICRYFGSIRLYLALLFIMPIKSLLHSWMFVLIWEQNQYCLTWKKLKVLCYESAIKHDYNFLCSPSIFMKNGFLISFSIQSDCFWWKRYINKPLQPHWSQQPLNPYFLKELPDGLIIPGTKMTNTDPFLWNGL